MFYGRLKKLKGTALAEVICEPVLVYFDIFPRMDVRNSISIIVNHLTSSKSIPYTASNISAPLHIGLSCPELTNIDIEISYARSKGRHRLFANLIVAINPE